MTTITKEIEEFCKRVGITPAQFVGEAPIKGNLWIEGDVTIPPGFAPIVGGTLDLGSVSTIPVGFAPKVGGPLYLGRATTIGNGFAPIVCTILDLSRATTIGEDFAPIVGSDLRLKSISNLPAVCSSIVGGTLYLNGRKTAKIKKLDPTKPIEVLGGKYIIADNLLTEVVSKHGNVWRVRCIGMDQVFYLVTDGFGNFAHGNTLANARASLIIKSLL